MERQDLSCTYLAHHELESIVIITILLPVLLLLLLIIIIIIIIIIVVNIVIINACCVQVCILDRQQWVGSMARQRFG